jgi:hypothetical protein
LTRRTPLFKIERNPLFKTAVACLLSRGSGRHGKGKNPVNGYPERNNWILGFAGMTYKGGKTPLPTARKATGAEGTTARGALLKGNLRVL